ncbi:hypothetical protein MOBT1_002789 [Malassezia obtusa]|uniref:Uncharacterized protein n=1 Tax=Malassezia obtusa TaxID=76774 RepID=A0AAF0E2X5_9BASI|nr:hypothetical protein MOBT1_002789 [Malassezia obtusa]
MHGLLGWAALLGAALGAAHSAAHGVAHAHIVSPDIPRVHAGEAHRIAHNDPSQLAHYDPDAVYNRVSLDNTVHPGHGGGGKGWARPAARGGSMLDVVGNGYREPINVIISGNSDRSVLSEQGLLDYVRSIGFSFECLHIHLGGLQHANLGDGNGWVPQLFEYRSLIYPGSPGAWVGACWESLAGGNHFRVWRQNGTAANTGAWFLAVSKEESAAEHHTIVPNGYDVGRNLLVAAVKHGGSFGGRSWHASVEWVDGLLPAGKQSINHNISIDGRVAVLTVHRT